MSLNDKTYERNYKIWQDLLNFLLFFLTVHQNFIIFYIVSFSYRKMQKNAHVK